MTKQEEIIQSNYERAKQLAEEIWLDGDHEGTPNDFYYFQCGFVAGLNHQRSQELDKMIAETIWMADRPRSWKEYFGDLFSVEIKPFHPFNFLFYKRPKMDANWHPSDDVYQWGFSLDLTTELYYYTYDWGKGFNCRILGFGFEIVKVDK